MLTQAGRSATEDHACAHPNRGLAPPRFGPDLVLEAAPAITAIYSGNWLHSALALAVSRGARNAHGEPRNRSRVGPGLAWRAGSPELARPQAGYPNAARPERDPNAARPERGPNDVKNRPNSTPTRRAGAGS